jgi:hypothetical protein
MTLEKSDTIDGFTSEDEQAVQTERPEPEVQPVFEVKPLQTSPRRAETREISKVVAMPLPRSTGKWSLWMRAVSYVVAIAVGAFGNHLWMTTPQQGKLTTSTVASATPTHQEVVSAVVTETADGSPIESATVEVVPTKEEVKLTETWLDQYTTRERDTLSAIGQHYCDNPMSYAGIAVDNRIKNPDVIPIGKTLNIRCRDATEEEWNSLYPDDPVDIEEPAQEEKEPATQVAGSELQVQVPSIDSPTRVPDETITVIATDEVSSTTDDTQVNPVDSDDAKAEPEGVTLPETVRQPQAVGQKKVLHEGLYVITVTGADVTVGEHPTLVNLNKDDEGRWNQVKTKTVVERIDGGDTRITLPLKKDVEFGDETFLVFDQGGGNVVAMGYDDLSGSRVRSAEGLRFDLPSKESYSALSLSFPKKPGKWSGFVKTTYEIVLPSALTFATASNPVGAGAVLGISLGKRFVQHKLNKAQSEVYNAFQQGDR